MSVNVEAVGRTTKTAPGMARQILIAVLAAALGLLALHPFCDLAFAAGHGDCTRLSSATGQHAAAESNPAGDSSVACGISVKDPTLVNPPEPLVSWTPGGVLVATLFAFAGLPLLASSRNSVRLRLASPPERSFYARSARILR